MSSIIDADKSPIHTAAALHERWERNIAASHAPVARLAVVRVSGTTPDWIDAGVAARQGEEITLVSSGHVWWVAGFGAGFGPQLGLWHRIDADGAIGKSIDQTTSFTADRDGPLLLVAKPPGEFLDESGRFDPDYPRDTGAGDYLVVVLVWRGAALDGLATLASIDESGAAQREYDRLVEGDRTPKGWRHLWRLGANRIYCEEVAVNDEPARLCCRVEDIAGILQYPVDVALDETTRLAWSWRIAELPSDKAEDSIPTHDYLSIAVEFENGQDLTYMWSSELPVGASFRCPLPWWDKRETHQVVRSGRDDLNRWLDEERPVLADYRRAIGGPEPKTIVAVWLIAVSLFQGRRGVGDYARIRLRGRAGETDVGPR